MYAYEAIFKDINHNKENQAKNSKSYKVGPSYNEEETTPFLLQWIQDLISS